MESLTLVYINGMFIVNGNDARNPSVLDMLKEWIKDGKKIELIVANVDARKIITLKRETNE